MTKALTDSFKDQRSEGSGHNEKNNSLKCNIRLLYTIELVCIVNGLPWRRFVLSEFF